MEWTGFTKNMGMKIRFNMTPRFGAGTLEDEGRERITVGQLR